jgi:hypothetical protein
MGKGRMIHLYFKYKKPFWYCEEENLTAWKREWTNGIWYEKVWPNGKISNFFSLKDYWKYRLDHPEL